MSARPLRDVFGIVCSTANCQSGGGADVGAGAVLVGGVGVCIAVGGARRSVAGGTVGRFVPVWSVHVDQGGWIRSRG